MYWPDGNDFFVGRYLPASYAGYAKSIAKQCGADHYRISIRFFCWANLLETNK